MSLVVKTGTASFTAGALTAVTISTGLGETIKAMTLHWTRQSADGTTDGIQWGFGAITGTAAEWCVALHNADAAATSATDVIFNTAASICDFTLGTTTVDFLADCTTWASGANSDQVVITPSNAPTVTTRVFWVAYGGTDITSAKAGTFTMASGAGPTSVTDPGFQPNAVIFASPVSIGSSGSRSLNAAVMLGAASSTATTDQCSTEVLSVSAAATMDDGARQLTNRAANFMTTGHAEGGQAHVSSWDATGFTLTHDNNTTAAHRMLYLAFAGTAQWKVISDTAATSVTTKAKTGVGFQPTALPLIVSASMASSSSIIGTAAGTEANLLGFSVGAYDGTTQNCTYFGEQDNNTASLSAMRQSTSLVIAQAAGTNVVATGSSTTFPATAAVSALGSDGFTMNWTAADATAREFWVLAVTGAPVAEVIPDLVTARRLY